MVLSVATTRVVVVILLFVFVFVVVLVALLLLFFAFAFCCHQMNIFPFDGVSAVGVVFWSGAGLSIFEIRIGFLQL